jgi:hypothetical protein
MNRTRIASRPASRKRLCDSFTPVGLSTSVDLIHRGPPLRNEKPRSVPYSLLLSAERSHSEMEHITIRVVAERESQVEDEMSSFSVELGREKKTETACQNRNAARASSLSRPLAWSIRHVPAGRRRTQKTPQMEVRRGSVRARDATSFSSPGDGSLGGVLVAIGNSDRSIDRSGV